MRKKRDKNDEQRLEDRIRQICDWKWKKDGLYDKTVRK